MPLILLLIPISAGLWGDFQYGSSLNSKVELNPVMMVNIRTEIAFAFISMLNNPIMVRIKMIEHVVSEIVNSALKNNFIIPPLIFFKLFINSEIEDNKKEAFLLLKASLYNKVKFYVCTVLISQ